MPAYVLKSVFYDFNVQEPQRVVFLRKDVLPNRRQTSAASIGFLRLSGWLKTITLGEAAPCSCCNHFHWHLCTETPGFQRVWKGGLFGNFRTEANAVTMSSVWQQQWSRLLYLQVANCPQAKISRLLKTPQTGDCVWSHLLQTTVLFNRVMKTKGWEQKSEAE